MLNCSPDWEKHFFLDICQRFEQDITMKSCGKVRASFEYFYFSHSCPRRLHLNAHCCFSNFFGGSKLFQLQEKQQGVVFGWTEHCLSHPCLPVRSKTEHFFTPKPKMAGYSYRVEQTAKSNCCILQQSGRWNPLNWMYSRWRIFLNSNKTLSQSSFSR